MQQLQFYFYFIDQSRSLKLRLLKPTVCRVNIELSLKTVTAFCF